MIITNINSVFETTKYDWKKYYKDISHICEITKTRIDNTKPDKFEMESGMEQVVLLKFLSDYFSISNFFEIGTGRGSSSYAVSLSDSVKDVFTIDIVRHEDILSDAAINHRKVIASNRDLFIKINIESKDKIHFVFRNDFEKISDNYIDKFDLCQIDGNHTNEDLILKDFELCKKVSKKDAIFIFDDYNNKFSVKKVVNDILKNDDFNSVLIELRGHIFNGKKPKDTGSGIVILSKRNISGITNNG